MVVAPIRPVAVAARFSRISSEPALTVAIASLEANAFKLRLRCVSERTGVRTPFCSTNSVALRLNRLAGFAVS